VFPASKSISTFAAVFSLSHKYHPSLALGCFPLRRCKPALEVGGEGAVEWGDVLIKYDRGCEFLLHRSVAILMARSLLTS